MKFRMLALLDRHKSSLDCAEFDDCVEMVNAGEYGIPFENLCEILYDKNILISKKEFEEMNDIGVCMGIDFSYYNTLKNIAKS